MKGQKRWGITCFIFLLTLVLLVGACGREAAPTPAPGVAPTPAPVATPPVLAPPTPPPIPTPPIAATATPAPVATATPTPAPPGVTTPTPTRTPTPTPAPEQPKYGGVLEFWARVFPASWDVHRDPTHTQYYTGQVFSTLVRFDPAVKSPSKIIPDLAERWETSPDGKVYTFYLRQGVKWHDGKPFTTEDVKYSLEKMADRKRSAVSGPLTTFERAEVVSDTVVKAYLKQPQPSLLPLLASESYQIQPKHLADVDYKTTKFIVGTGPFKFKEYISGVSYELVKNPDYYLPGLPYLEGIKIYIIEDRAAQVAAFVAKRVQMMNPVLSCANKECLEEVVAKVPQTAIDWFYAPIGAGLTGKFATGQPWNDARVRFAINLVLDRVEITTAGWGGPEWAGGLKTGVTGFLPYGSPYGLSQEEVTRQLGHNKPFSERLAEAKKLMAEAGYPNGFKARVLYRSGLPEYTRAVTVIGDQLKKSLGIELSQDIRDLATMGQMRTQGDWDLHFEVQLRGYVGDPDEMLSAFVTGAPQNFGKYSRPKADELYGQQSMATDPQQRQKLNRELQLILLGDLPTIVMRWVTYSNHWYPDIVKGYQVTAPGAYLGLRMDRVWLAK